MKTLQLIENNQVSGNKLDDQNAMCELQHDIFQLARNHRDDMSIKLNEMLMEAYRRDKYVDLGKIKRARLICKTGELKAELLELGAKYNDALDIYKKWSQPSTFLNYATVINGDLGTEGQTDGERQLRQNMTNFKYRQAKKQADTARRNRNVRR